MKALLQRPGLVGRSAELALLHEELEAATRGSGRCVVIHGDPGVGKTRLLGEFLATAKRRALVLQARAYPLGTSTPFALISDAFEDHLGTLPAATLVQLAGPAPALAAILPSLQTASGEPSSEANRTHVLEELNRLQQSLSAQRPVVLALDDVHLADPSTWEAFHHLALHGQDHRLLLVVALRTEALEASASLADLIGSLVQDWVARELVLAPLDRSTLWELARRALGRNDVQATVAEWLYQKTLGNPLYAMGYLQALAERGEELDTSALNEVPDTLRRRVSTRVAGLSPEARRVLEAAAVLGQRSSPALLAEVGNISATELPALLDELVARRLLDEEPAPAGVFYDFVHPLVQEAVYEGVGALRRRSLHLAAARSLSAQGRPGAAAEHYARGAEPGDSEALQFVRQAAREAESTQSHHEAVSHLQAALTLARDPDQRRELLDELAWQAGLAGDYGAGIPPLQELRMLTRESDVSTRVLTELRLASLLSAGLGDPAQAEAALAAAERIAAESGDASLRARALIERSWIVGIGGDVRQQVALASEALTAARRLGDKEGERNALGSLGHASVVIGSIDAGADALTAGLELAKEAGDLSQMAWHGGQVPWAMGLRGEVEEGLEYERALRREIPEAHHAHILEFEGFVKWLAGRWVEAAADCQRMTGSWSPAGFTSREIWALATAVISLAEMGRLGDAAAIVARVKRRNLADFYWMTPWYRHALGLLDLAEGRREEAAAAFETAARQLDDMGADALAPLAWVELADVAPQISDLDRAAIAVEGLERVQPTLPRPLYAGLLALARGRLEEGRGASAAATEAANTAVDTFVDSPFKFFAARALELRGRLAAAGGAGRGTAAEDFTMALAAYRELPAPARADAVLKRLESLGAEGRRLAARARGAAALSPRERAVAVLAARGLTAKEIAQRLFIGERTVESHLASAYAKLGLASKRELMSRARELQLDPGA